MRVILAFIVGASFTWSAQRFPIAQEYVKVYAMRTAYVWRLAKVDAVYKDLKAMRLAMYHHAAGVIRIPLAPALAHNKRIDTTANKMFQ